MNFNLNNLLLNFHRLRRYLASWQFTLILAMHPRQGCLCRLGMLIVVLFYRHQLLDFLTPSLHLLLIRRVLQLVLHFDIGIGVPAPALIVLLTSAFDRFNVR